MAEVKFSIPREVAVKIFNFLCWTKYVLNFFYLFQYDVSRCVFLYHKETKICRRTKQCNVISHSTTCFGFVRTNIRHFFLQQFKNKRNNTGTSEYSKYPVSQIVTNIFKTTAASFFRVKIQRCQAEEDKHLQFNLKLYAPCIILQYVYKPTRCTKFLWLYFIFY